ncbi:MAG: CHAT domain-containing protein [Acidobacteria bacterium]|nr:CHAT domain-containing protein [Acidobacteriota bacterium]
MRIQEYLDFVLSVEKGDGASYPVHVLVSPAGKSKTTMQLPVSSEDWQSRLSIVADARGGSPKAGPVQADALGILFARSLGEDLFGALLSGDVLRCYEASLKKAKAEDKGLRIRLRMQAPELANLPWEYLMDSGQSALSLARHTPIVRQLDMDSAVTRLKLQPPIRILGMIGHHENLDVAAEKESIEDAIEQPLFSGTMKLDWVSGHTFGHLEAALKKNEYQVFHFIGHGIFDEESGTGKIVLEDKDGKSHALDASELGRLLAAQKSLRVVVLNSCEGAKSSQANLFSSTAAILASHGLPAIISMQYEISDFAALEFSRGFYNSLSDGNPIEEAVYTARNSIKIVLGETVEWATPVLNLRSQDGLLFEVDVASALGLTQMVSEDLAPVEPATAQLTSLASCVKEYWIDSVLRHKLDQSARLDLGKELVAGDVMSTYGAEALTPGEVFSKLGNLLILGDPGSGKTVALLELARGLLEEASLGIPVIYNLSSWAERKGSLSDWMAAELASKYLISKSLAAQWIEERKLIALLDGLDEVQDSARIECVAAINQWLGSPQRTGVVVCCRTREYCDLPAKLALHGAVRLQTLSRDQVLTFVAEGGEPLAALRKLLVRDSGLLIDARSPLMLSLMVRAYKGLDAEAAELRSERGIAARRAMVMDAYVKREFQRAREGGSLV